MTIDLSETGLDSELVFDGKLLKVRRDTVRLPDGNLATREYINHPGAVVVLALCEGNRLLFERQHRYPLHRDFIEFPAGKIDPGEDSLDCAKRELLEETGYVAGCWSYLTTIHPCIGYSDEKLVYYLARDLEHRGSQLDHDEFLETFTLPLSDALEQLRAGLITDVKTVAGLFWAEKIASNAWRI